MQRRWKWVEWIYSLYINSLQSIFMWMQLLVLLHLFIGYDYLLSKFWKHEMLWQMITQLILKESCWIQAIMYQNTIYVPWALHFLETWNGTFSTHEKSIKEVLLIQANQFSVYERFENTFLPSIAFELMREKLFELHQLMCYL